MQAPSTTSERAAGRRVQAPFRVLLVCTANHCRSPLAESMLLRAIERRGVHSRVAVESAALRPMKVGQAPSPLTRATAARRGLELVGHGTWASPERIASSDLIVCMDHEQAEELARDLSLSGNAVSSRSNAERIRLLLEFAPECGRDEVPDPHGRDSFAHELVADLIERGVEGLADALARMFDERE
ncbi:MAG: hypothetical protein ACO3NL_12715 [Phycisphaerales bacterium]